MTLRKKSLKSVLNSEWYYINLLLSNVPDLCQTYFIKAHQFQFQKLEAYICIQY